MIFSVFFVICGALSKLSSVVVSWAVVPEAAVHELVASANENV